VSTRSASWSRPAELALLAACGVCAFAAAWGVLHLGVYSGYQIRDTAEYQEYGEAVLDGLVPYRDFDVEYPPGAFSAFVLPALGSPSVHAYRIRFDLLMLLCGVAAVVAVAATLLLGSVVLSRYDLLPAALTAAALAALCSGRDRLSFVLLGLGAATKIYPALLAPLFLAHVWRRRGRREAGLAAGIMLAVVAAIFVPFLILGPGGAWDTVVEQTTRPLQIESLGSAVLIAGHHLFGVGVHVDFSHGSQNLGGSLPNAVGAVQSALVLAGLAGLWLWFGRRQRDAETLLRASAASVCLFVALGKVLSPQYLIWLIPLVPLVRGRRGVAAGGVFAAALLLTQLWFPGRYWDLVFGFGDYESALVLARDLVLLVLLAVLLWPEARAAVPDTCPAPPGQSGHVRTSRSW
jgi:hypothetical protein